MTEILIEKINHRFSVLRYLHYQTQKPIEALIMVDTKTAALIDQKFKNNQKIYKIIDFKMPIQ